MYQVLTVDHYNIGSLRISSTPEDPIFCYKVLEEVFKVYRPNSEKYRFVWVPGEDSKPAGWYFGLDHCSGDQEIYITGGEKDVMTLVSQGKEAITLNSETASMPQDLAEKLKGRYKKIIVLYDSDSTGVKHSKKICEEFGFIRGILPAGVKDVSDMIRDGRNIDEIQHEEIKQKPPNAGISRKLDFFKVTRDKEGRINGLKIIYTKYDGILESLGFQRYDIDNGHIYVKIQNRIVEEVSKTKIQDHFMDFLKKLPEKLGDDVTREMLVEKFKSNPAVWFCENRFNFLTSDARIELSHDTKKDAFIYYRNGFVKCTPSGYELMKYSELDGFIWKNQIKDRDFIKPRKQHLGLDDFGVYGKFIFNIAGANDERWRSICSIIGYNLHSYTDVKLKATVLTDSKISEKPDGRTGKTLFCKALGEIRNYCEINGKQFNPNKDFKYQEAKIDTQIICINDVKNSKRHQFDFEDMFNDITEGVVVEKKNQQPFTIHPKIIVTTNKTLDIEGASARDRAIEFEFSDHYSDKWNPFLEFGCWFFKDWTKDEWQKFDNFMMFCICLYLEKGIIDPPQINLHKRKLLDRTCSEFVDFMNDKYESGQIKLGTEYDKKQLHDEFLEAHSDLKNTLWQYQRNFTNALKLWALYTPGIRDDVKERRSGKDLFITFYTEL